MMKNMFKFLSKKLRFKIHFHFNYIHFISLSTEFSKKPKTMLMLKISIEMYHDSAPFHKFRNKNQKSKTERLMFLFSKLDRSDQFAFCLLKKFDEIATKNQMIFMNEFDTFQKKMKFHEILFHQHRDDINNQKKKYQMLMKK